MTSIHISHHFLLKFTQNNFILLSSAVFIVYHLIINEKVDIWEKKAALNEVPFCTSLHLKTSTSHCWLAWLKFREGIHSASSRKKQRMEFLGWPQQLERKGRNKEKERNREGKSHVLDINSAQISDWPPKLCMCGPVYQEPSQAKKKSWTDFSAIHQKEAGLEIGFSEVNCPLETKTSK